MYATCHAPEQLRKRHVSGAVLPEEVEQPEQVEQQVEQLLRKRARVHTSGLMHVCVCLWADETHASDCGFVQGVGACRRPVERCVVY
jgi:hypothetical protein